jgi:hypothetical protein
MYCPKTVLHLPALLQAFKRSLLSEAIAKSWLTTVNGQSEATKIEKIIPSLSQSTPLNAKNGVKLMEGQFMAGDENNSASWSSLIAALELLEKCKRQAGEAKQLGEQRGKKEDEGPNILLKDLRDTFVKLGQGTTGNGFATRGQGNRSGGGCRGGGAQFTWGEGGVPGDRGFSLQAKAKLWL